MCPSLYITHPIGAFLEENIIEMTIEAICNKIRMSYVDSKKC